MKVTRKQLKKLIESDFQRMADDLGIDVDIAGRRTSRIEQQRRDSLRLPQVLAKKILSFFGLGDLENPDADLLMLLDQYREKVLNHPKFEEPDFKVFKPKMETLFSDKSERGILSPFMVARSHNMISKEDYNKIKMIKKCLFSDANKALSFIASGLGDSVVDAIVRNTIKREYSEIKSELARLKSLYDSYDQPSSFEGYGGGSYHRPTGEQYAHDRRWRGEQQYKISQKAYSLEEKLKKLEPAASVIM